MSEHTKCVGHSTNVNSTGDLEHDPAKAEESASDTLTADTITNNMLENLTMQDSQESEMLRMLNRELNELFDLHHKQDYQAMECSRKRLSCFFEKLVRYPPTPLFDNILFYPYPLFFRHQSVMIP